MILTKDFDINLIKDLFNGGCMFKLDGYTKQFTDIMSDGFIFIDNKGIIQIYNNKAKEIFGIINKYESSHDSGRIEDGDIVIIADSSIGEDDGGLIPENLAAIGIKDSNINIGDAIIAVGKNNEKNSKPEYIISKRNNHEDKLELTCTYSNIQINSCIDFLLRLVNIAINDEVYSMDYIKCIGHIVIIDGKSKKLKFYQSKGYTTRNESIYDILTGKTFRSKGRDSELFDVIGKNIFEIHKDNTTIMEFHNAAAGLDFSYIEQYREINGKPMICSLYPINIGHERLGAVLKINDISEFEKIIKERYEALRNLYEIERKLSDEETMKILFPDFIGESKEIVSVKKLALKVSNSNSTVLILGESGTGKSILAKAIHDNSKNKGNPFIAVNCASIPETLLESELFGYEKGAFTGAKNEGKTGLFELAQGGTLLLDEIGEISPFLQVKLLHVLQDKSFYKVGGKDIINLKARIIVATNKNLEEEVQKGNFREDLYYRINVFPIWIPPLRNRKQDVYSLIKALLPKICTRIGCDEKRISGEAINLLTSYDYPGNIRELENILERAVNITEGNTIFSKHISTSNQNIKKNMDNDIKPLKYILAEMEKDVIKKALQLSKGDKKTAMELLKIGKTNFYEKIKKYNLD